MVPPKSSLAHRYEDLHFLNCKRNLVIVPYELYYYAIL